MSRLPAFLKVARISDSTSGGASGVYGQKDGGGYGVAGRITKPGFGAMLADAGSTGSIGIWPQSFNGVGANVVDNSTSGVSPALSVVGANTSGSLHFHLSQMLKQASSNDVSFSAIDANVRDEL
jgi:hypothetical protein